MKTNPDGSVTLSGAEIDAMIARGETKTDWTRVAATTPEDVERQIAEDPDLTVPARWKETIRSDAFPSSLTVDNKRQVTICLDTAVIDFSRPEVEAGSRVSMLCFRPTFGK